MNKESELKRLVSDGGSSLGGSESNSDGGSGERDFIEENCGYCQVELQIPADIHRKFVSGGGYLEGGRENNGFFISPNRYYYCNSNHYNLFTED